MSKLNARNLERINSGQTKYPRTESFPAFFYGDFGRLKATYFQLVIANFNVKWHDEYATFIWMGYLYSICPVKMHAFNVVQTMYSKISELDLRGHFLSY